MSMKQVNHKELEVVIDEHYKKRLPLFIHGDTGIGKSVTVREVAKRIAESKGLEYSDRISDVGDNNKFILIDRRASQFDPTDIKGVPTIHEESNSTKWHIPNFLPREGQGIIFFDELNLAPPLVQASCYQLINDRQIDDYVLPDGYIVVGAGNRLEDNANIFDFARPLQGRFNHVELRCPSIDAWIDWAIEHNIDHRIQAFLKFRPDLLHNIPNDSREYSFPIERKWEWTSNLINDIEDMDRLELLLGTAVGDGVSNEMVEFLKLTRKVDVKDLIKNPEKVRGIQEINMKYATISALIHYFKEDRKILKAYCKIAECLEPEFGILLFRNIKKRARDFMAKEVVKLPEWDKLSKTITKYAE